LFFDIHPSLPFGQPKIILQLKIEPELGVHSEKPLQPQGSVGGNHSLPVNDFADPIGGYPNVAGQLVDADLQRLQEIFFQNCGMEDHQSFSRLSLDRLEPPDNDNLMKTMVYVGMMAL